MNKADFYQWLRIGWLLLALLTAEIAHAQISEQADPLRPKANVADSTRRVGPRLSDSANRAAVPRPPSYVLRYRLGVDGTFNGGNLSRALLQLTGAVDYDLSQKFKLSTNPSFLYGQLNGLLNERELFGDLRATFLHERRFYYLAFGSLESSNLRKISRRSTAAAGVGYKILNHPNAYLSITNVLLQETTDFTERADISLLRNSARLFGEYKFGSNDRWSVTHTLFYQPALTQRNLRYNASVSVAFQFSSALSFRVNGFSSYESVVVPGRKNFDYRITTGLVYERK